MDAETARVLATLQTDVKHLTEEVHALSSNFSALADRISGVTQANGRQDTKLSVDHEQIEQLEQNCTKLTNMMEGLDRAQQRNDGAIGVLWQWHNWQLQRYDQDQTRTRWTVGMVVTALVPIGIAIVGLIAHVL